MSTKYNLPNGVTRLQSLASSYKILTDPIALVTMRMKRFGGTYSAVIPGKGRVIITQDGDFINYVLREHHTNYQKADLGNAEAVKQFGSSLLFTNGDDWRRQRRLIQPAFHHGSIQQLYNTVINTINESLISFPQGDNIDIYPLMRQLSFSVLINSLFNISISKQLTDELSSAFIDMQAFMLKDIFHPFKKLMYPFTGEEKKVAERWVGIRKMLKEIVDRRRADDQPHNDLLNMLLSARYEDTDEGMDDDLLISELLVLLFAGHETTGATVSWLLYLISSDKKVLEKITNRIAEIDIMDSPRDSYINAVISEGMRLYPAVWLSERLTINDDEFKGYTYPGGTSILTYLYGMHRSAAYWEDPEKFNPERFLTEEGTINKNIKNYFPFGAGPRMCIGNNFAMAEIAFILHAIFNAFQIKPTATPRAWPLLTMRPREVILNIKKK
nr:cytochrome P450 [uncultured Mucilaginibacter sp.]